MSDPWFKFYPSDWLSGTRGLSPAEAGVYITLIAMMYERGDDLDRDDRRLARLCNCSPAPFSKIVKALIGDGKLIERDGRLTNARVLKERSIRENNSKKASIAAQTRWSMEEEKTQQKQSEVDADASAKQCSNNAIPEARSQMPDKEKKARKRATRLPEDWNLPDDWKTYATANGLSSNEADQLAAELHGWSLTKPNGTSLDWKRTWQTWCRKHASWGKRSRSHDFSWAQRVGTA